MRLCQSEHEHSALNDASLQRFHNGVLIGPRGTETVFHVNHFSFWLSLSLDVLPAPPPLSFLSVYLPLSFRSPISLSVLLSSQPPPLFFRLSAFMNEEEIHERQIRGRATNVFLVMVVGDRICTGSPLAMDAGI